MKIILTPSMFPNITATNFNAFKWGFMWWTVWKVVQNCEVDWKGYMVYKISFAKNCEKCAVHLYSARLGWYYAEPPFATTAASLLRVSLPGCTSKIWKFGKYLLWKYLYLSQTKWKTFVKIRFQVWQFNSLWIFDWVFPTDECVLIKPTTFQFPPLKLFHILSCHNSSVV